MLLEREKIAVHGIVQGVGFRPFIHKLVQEYGLRGFIKNTSSGVELELEGERETLERFTEALPLRAPKLAPEKKAPAPKPKTPSRDGFFADRPDIPVDDIFGKEDRK